jgi:hypothetical protein
MMMSQRKNFELPTKRNKVFIRGMKRLDAVAFIMKKYLSKWDVPQKVSEEEFALHYFNLMLEKVKSGEVRLVLPHNLGYMQVLEHQYTGRNVEHLKKFGNVDYSLIWVRHPMFVHHRIKAGKKLNEEIRQRKLDGARYLTDYVDGDTYVA